MMPPLFLALSDAVEICVEQIELYGGGGGVLRDAGLLESAMAAPRAGIDEAYFHSDLFAMAAAYLFHIVRNHPFFNGNKRTALACAYLFLAINGFAVECEEDELTEMVLSAARGEASKEGIAAFLRNCAVEWNP